MTDPIKMEFMRRIAGSAAFGICPGIAVEKDSSGLRPHGCCIYNKKEIIIGKNREQKVTLAPET